MLVIWSLSVVIKRIIMILIIKHVSVEGPGIIKDFFLSRGFYVKEIDFEQKHILPDDIESLQAVILLGGPMNVYQEKEYPFLIQENAFIKKLILSKKPILGICLGAQLIAKACAAKISKASEPEVGWMQVQLTKEGKQFDIFCGFGDDIKVFQWHEDKFDIPEQARVLAQSDVCPQAFLINRNCYAFQFHFEVTEAMVNEWINFYKTDGLRDQLLIDIDLKINNLNILGQRILINFLKLIKQGNTQVC